MQWLLKLKFLKRPYVAYVAAAASFVLTLPALWGPLEIDDIFHRAIFLKYDRSGFERRNPQEMFRFLSGDVNENRRLMDQGFLPWWTHPEIKAEFLQFLTVQTHAFDYALWPHSPMMMHAHSMLWLSLVVLLASLWYRRLLASAWTAGLAALLFAFDDAHGTPAGWVCNRNVLVAAAFGLGALLCHHQWRGQGRSGRPHWAIASSFLFACSLFSKEEGLATSAYLGAHVFFLDKTRGPWRLLTLVPYTAIVLVWRSVRDGLGYGISHIGLYIDPVDHPREFALAAVERAPILLLGQLAGPPSDIYGVFKAVVGAPMMLWAVLFLTSVLILLTPLLKVSASARFSLCGMLLAVIPVCATMPSDRLLVFPSIGAMSLVAEAISFAAFGAGSVNKPAFRRLALSCLALFWLLLHGVLSPLLLLNRAGNPLGSRSLSQSFYVHVPDEEVLTDRTVVVVSAPSPIHAAYLPVLREFAELSAPKYVRALAPGFSNLHVRRSDEKTLIIRAEHGYIRMVLDQLFRDDRYPMKAGDKVELSQMQAEILQVTDDSHPLVVKFTFEEPLESSHYLWTYWRAGKWQTFPLPQVGQELWIEAPKPFDASFCRWDKMPQGVRTDPPSPSASE